MAKQDPRWQDVRGIQAGAMGQAYDRAGALFGQAMQAGQNILDDQVQRESASIMEQILNAGTTEEVEAARAAGAGNKWADQAAVGAAGIQQKDKIFGREETAEQRTYDRGRDTDLFDFEKTKYEETRDFDRIKHDDTMKAQYAKIRQSAANAAINQSMQAAKFNRERVAEYGNNFINSLPPITKNDPTIVEGAKDVLAAVTPEGGLTTRAAVEAGVVDWVHGNVSNELPQALEVFAQGLGTTVDKLPAGSEETVRAGLIERYRAPAELMRQQLDMETGEGQQEYSLTKSSLTNRFESTSWTNWTAGNRKASNKMLNTWETKYSPASIKRAIEGIPEDTPVNKMGEAFIRADLLLMQEKFGRVDSKMEKSAPFQKYHTILTAELDKGVNEPTDAVSALRRAHNAFEDAMYTGTIIKLGESKNMKPEQVLKNKRLSEEALKAFAKSIGVDPKDVEKRTYKASGSELQIQRGNELMAQ